MNLGWFDLLTFLAFFLVAIGTALYKSRGERTGEDFFLASRSLIWPLIGLGLCRIRAHRAAISRVAGACEACVISRQSPSRVNSNFASLRVGWAPATALTEK